MSILEKIFPSLKSDPQVGDVWELKMGNPFEEDILMKVVDIRGKYVQYVYPEIRGGWPCSMEVSSLKGIANLKQRGDQE